MGSFPTRPFQESKPQNGDPDKFSSTPRRKTKILAPSILWVAECQHLQPRNQREKKLTKICYGYTGSLSGRFSWPNNEKLQREGNNHFLSE